MSYCIYLEDLNSESIVNLSWNKFDEQDELIIQTEQFNYYYADYVNDRDKEYETEDEHKLGLVDDFRGTQAYDELRDTFCPMMNYVHILQQEPMEKQVALVEKYAGICVLIEIEKLDVYAIALTGGGMDLSDNIELAYYLTDGVSPIETRQVMSLSKDAERLLHFCRDKVRTTGSVCYSEIDSFIKGM